MTSMDDVRRQQLARVCRIPVLSRQNCSTTKEGPDEYYNLGRSKDALGRSKTTLPVDRGVLHMRLTTVRSHSEKNFHELPSEIHEPVLIFEQDYLVGRSGKV